MSDGIYNGGLDVAEWVLYAFFAFFFRDPPRVDFQFVAKTRGVHVDDDGRKGARRVRACGIPRLAAILGADQDVLLDDLGLIGSLFLPWFGGTAAVWWLTSSAIVLPSKTRRPVNTSAMTSPSA